MNVLVTSLAEGAGVEVLTEEGQSLPLRVGPPADAPALALSAMVYVSKGGSDTTGTGSFLQPFLTIQKAMDSILDATPTKRYGVSVQPGRYTDAFALKPNVEVIGVHSLLTQIRGAVSLDATWSAAGDNRSGFKNVLFGTVAQTFDFAAVSSPEGKLTFESCVFNSVLTLASFSAINQCESRLCTYLGGLTQTGFVHTMTACLFQNAGAIALNGRTGQTTILGLYAGDMDGNLAVVAAAGQTTLLELGAFSLLGGALTLDGADITCNASPGSLPPTITLLNGAASPRPDITGSRGANAALASLLTGLESIGLLTDSTVV